MFKREPSQEGLRGDPKGGGGVGRLTQPEQNVLHTGPDTQSRNAFKHSKGTERKKGEKREGGRKEKRRKRRNESRGDTCLTLKNCSGSNLHIYDHSPE